MDDHRIIFIVRKNSIFTTKPKQTELTLKEVVMSLSMMKPHHECKYKGFSTGFQEQGGEIHFCQEKSKSLSLHVYIHSFWTLVTVNID